MGQRRFSAADRQAILAAVAGKPTGVVCTIAGMEFDLVAPTTTQLLEILESLETLATLQGKPGGEVLAELGSRGPKLVRAVRDLLYRSAFYGEPTPAPEDAAVFDEWFGAIDPMTLFKSISAPLIQAAGAGSVGGGQDVADPSRAATAPNGTPGTQ